MLTEAKTSDGWVGTQVSKLIGMKANVLLRSCIAIGCRNVGTPEKTLFAFAARMTSPFEREALTFVHLCVHDVFDDLAGLFHWGWKEGR